MPDIDIILGGHDHHYVVKKLGDVWLCKSGTDMRDLTEIRVTIPAAAAGEARERPTITTKRISITSDIQPHEHGVKLVAKYKEVMGAKMGQIIAETAVGLDGIFSHVRCIECHDMCSIPLRLTCHRLAVAQIRTRETNLGNLVCDVVRAHTKADAALVQAGTFRADEVRSHAT